MRSVWICSRNDAVGNAAVLIAAMGVFGTGTRWPDIAVATIMGALGLWGGWQIVARHAAKFALNALRPSLWLRSRGMAAHDHDHDACEELREHVGINHATFQIEDGNGAHPCSLRPAEVV